MNGNCRLILKLHKVAGRTYERDGICRNYWKCGECKRCKPYGKYRKYGNYLKFGKNVNMENFDNFE